VTGEQQRWLQLLSRCTFLPGSFEKRLVRSLAALGTHDLLTEKQAACLEKLAWKYRRQRGEPHMERPVRVPAPDVAPPSRHDREQLKAWNEGKPR
jgi:hypothetical protein